MKISKYLAVFKIAWEQGLVYRLNFTLWRVRSVLQLLLAYFIWWTVFQSQNQIFGYTGKSIITYILVAALIRAVVLSSRVMDVSNQINNGSVVNFLIKPLGFIKYYLAQDVADKLLNISFVIVEISLILLLLRPDIILQTNQVTLGLFLLASVLGVILYFAIAFIIGISTFWVEASWGPMFLMTIFLEGFAGGLFPIDILPRVIYNGLMLTPFPYLMYFPAKIYIGTMNESEIMVGFLVLVGWTVGMFIVANLILRAGLKHYSAVGN